MPVDPIHLIIFLLIGAIAGWLAGQIMRGGGFGILGNIIVGVLGAFLAGWLLPGLFPFGFPVAQILSATLGAVILLFVIGLVKRA